MAYAAVALFLPVPPFEPWLRAQSIIGRGPLFLFGILGAWLYRRHGEAIRTSLAANRWLASGGADLVLVIVFLALALLLRWSTLRGFLVRGRTRWSVWPVPGAALWPAILLTVLLAPLRAKGLLSNAALARLGVLSYSIYMLPLPVLSSSIAVARRLFPSLTGWSVAGAAWFVVATVLCVGLASGTYPYIERPFLVRKARLLGQGRAAQARAA